MVEIFGKRVVGTVFRRLLEAFLEFEIIGEAVGKLSEQLKGEYPEIPWQDIKDFRNLLAHEYFGVDLEIVWNTIHNDLPILLDAVQKIVERIK